MTLTICDGESRVLLDDDINVAELCELIGAGPHRASSIEPITYGPHRGWYVVDLSPLFAIHTGVWPCCLATRFATRGEAIRAEVAWLKENFLGLEEP